MAPLVESVVGWEATLPLERSRLVRLCLRLTGDVDAVEDLAQQTLYEAWSHLHQVHDPTGLDRWLSAIARNVCLRWAHRHGQELLQRAQPNPGAEGDDAWSTFENVAIDDFDVEVELERRELVSLLDRALALLPPETRAALVQRYVEDSPVAEVAARLGVSPGAVTMKLQRGKLALRRVLTTRFPGEAIAHGLFDVTDGIWQETRLWCTHCGTRRLHGILDHRQGLLMLRCPVCDALAGTCERTTDSRMLATAKGFRPALERVRAMIARHYLLSLQQNPMPCPGCGHPVLVQSATPWGWHGVSRRCERCHHGAQTSFDAIALALPEGKRFLQDHPRIRRLPDRDVEIGGTIARISSFESVTGQARLDAIATRDTCRLISIHTRP